MSHAILHAMITTMDASGRLVIPKDVREEAGLKPGEPLEVRCQDGRVEIEPAPLKLKLVRRGRLLVAVPESGTPPLRPEEVEAVRDQIRRGRGDDSA